MKLFNKQKNPVKELGKIIDELGNYEKSKEMFSNIDSKNLPSIFKNTYSLLKFYFEKQENNNKVIYDITQKELDIMTISSNYSTATKINEQSESAKKYENDFNEIANSKEGKILSDYYNKRMENLEETISEEPSHFIGIMTFKKLKEEDEK
ncbi:MAG: hypothetical protein WC393_04580, partial [Candidatus Nanoarchaeia archaeon]|jgi:lipoate synthase